MSNEPMNLRFYSVVGLAWLCAFFIILALLLPARLAYAQVPTPTSTVAATSTSTVTPTRTPSQTATPDPLQCTSVGWSLAAEPALEVSPETTLALVEDIAVVGPDDVWAVGRYIPFYGGRHRALTLHWDGSLWTSVPNPSLDALGAGLDAVGASSSDNVWAVGIYSLVYGPQLLIERWDGQRWNLIPGPQLDDVEIHDVEVLSPNDVWIVGYFSDKGNGSGALILHWDGTSWTRHTAPGSVYQLQAVAAAAPDDVWAVSTKIFHWDGTDWAEVPNPNTGGNGLYDIAVIAPDDIWSVGWFYTFCYPDCSTFAPTINHWDGKQWRAVPHPVPMDYKLESVTANGPDNVWVVGHGPVPYDHMIILHWDGTQWNDVTPPLGHHFDVLTSIKSAGPNDMWSFGYYRQKGGGETTRLLTMRYAELPAFADVPHGSTFYQQVQCLSCRGVISGYGCGAQSEPCEPYNAPYFRPNYQVTRGQLAKIVSNAAGYTESPDPQIFEDVPPSNTFYQWINRLARRGYMSGYPCGGPGEPCVNGDMPYFRPVTNATRGQTSKIVSNAAGYTELPTEQTFEDVPPTHTFYREIQRLASRSIMGGYPCGGVGEPCLSGKPYFRPGNNVTRGQSAKIVANTFYPECNP